MAIKAVFHIDEIEKWTLLIGNIKNLYKAINNETFEVEVVANSTAVKECLKESSTHLEALKDLNKIGIKLCACQNSLWSLHKEQADLIDFIEVVPSGVKEIIEKQSEGFAYLKP